MNIHPRSRNFAWKDASAEGAKRLTAQQIHSFNEQGFFILPGVFSGEEIAAVTAAIDPLEKIFDDDLRAQGGKAGRKNRGGQNLFHSTQTQAPDGQALWNEDTRVRVSGSRKNPPKC